jgi:anti-anti-sigma factor
VVVEPRLDPAPHTQEVANREAEIADLSFDQSCSPSLLGLRVRELAGAGTALNVLVVADGEINETTAPALADSLQDANERAAASLPGCVIVDLAHVTFMTSMGVRALLAARTTDGVLRIAAPSGSALQVLHLAAPDLFDIYASVGAAALLR